MINFKYEYLLIVFNWCQLVRPTEQGFYDKIIDATINALQLAVTSIPPDVEEAIRRAYIDEENEIARAQLKAILDNIELARRLKKPVCQDTGLIHYYVKLGLGFPGARIVEKALIDATRRATELIPLRPNTVDPFRHFNPGDNTGRGVPVIHWEIDDSDRLEYYVVPKGGGSEAVSVLRLPPPARGLESLPEIIVDAVLEADGKPCPPVIVGVGIGGGVDTAVYLAKRAASLRRIGSRNPDPLLARLEEKLYNALNKLGIGVMGLGGKHTVLAVHIDYAYRHPANYPAAIVFQCWATRRAHVVMDPNGEYRIEQ